ncbi:MAG: hypothetical protein QXW70_04000 [Candidatus Anstonellales archaeon]
MPIIAEKILKSLEIMPLEKVILHEQTIAENIAILTESMLNIGRLVDPIIVDNKYHVVLDGNHRRQVLQNLKAPLVICQTIDYMNPAVKVGGWFPTFLQLPAGIEKFPSEEVDFEVGRSELEKNRAYFMLVCGNKRNCRLFPTERDELEEVIRKQEEIMREINGKENGQCYYYEDTMADEALSQKMYVFWRRNYSKDEIIKEAVAGRPFPPKSTRHMIPERIIRLNLPLGWLYEEKSEVWNLLEGMIRKRAVNHNVRRYTEPVIVIY